MVSGVLSQFIDQHSRVFAVIYGYRDQLDTALSKSVFKRRHQPLSDLHAGTSRALTQATKPGFPKVMPKSAKPSVACFHRIVP
jgi:hypothetical protein